MHSLFAKHGIEPDPLHAAECDADCACRGDLRLIPRYVHVRHGQPRAAFVTPREAIDAACGDAVFLGCDTVVIDRVTGARLAVVDGVPGAYDAWVAAGRVPGAFETVEDHRATYPRAPVTLLVDPLPEPIYELEPCRWRGARDPHCNCFRCFALPLDELKARASAPGLAPCDCYWCVHVAREPAAGPAPKTAPKRRRPKPPAPTPVTANAPSTPPAAPPAAARPHLALVKVPA